MSEQKSDTQYRQLTAADGNFIEGDEFASGAFPQYRKVGANFDLTYPGGLISGWVEEGPNANKDYRARRPIPAEPCEEASLLKWLEGVKGSVTYVDEAFSSEHYHVTYAGAGCLFVGRTPVDAIKFAKANWDATQEHEAREAAKTDKDRKAFDTWYNSTRGWVGLADAWHAGVAYARRAK
jgi:hypothetical protein